MKQTRHESFWFADGSIILATNSRLYRIHKGVLTSQSKFFRELFELPIDPDDEDVTIELEEEADVGDEYDGLPVVTMAGDEDDHVECLVKTLYDPYEWHVIHLFDSRFIDDFSA